MDYFDLITGAIGTATKVTATAPKETGMDYSNLISSLAGTLIGGLITFWTTKYNLKRTFEEQRENLRVQFEEQRKRDELLAKKNELIALTTVNNELIHNHAYLERIYEHMLKHGHKMLDYNSMNNIANLKMDKWIKHSDTIECIDGIDFLSHLFAFYSSLTHEINTQTVTFKRVEGLLEQCIDAINRTKEYLKEHKQ